MDTWARGALIADEDGARAIERALADTTEPGMPPTDLALLFASPTYGPALPGMVRTAYRESGASVLLGCSGQAIIGTSREIEGAPAVSLLRLALPGTRLSSAYVTQGELGAAGPLGGLEQAANGVLAFADPFHLDTEALLGRLQADYRGTTVVGGLASGDHHARATSVFLNGVVYAEGAALVGLAGAARLHAVVSQGCTPIGRPWTITAARQNVLEHIGNRPAYEVLVETVRALPQDVQRRARGNLFVGLAMDEYRADFQRGDFLIRNLLGADTERGMLAVGAQVRVGQTLQFQLRDRTAADEDLRELLDSAALALDGQRPAAALLCACNGRGAGLFGQPDHDADALAARFGPLPVAGLFCNGEIGPVGGSLFLHGYTASIALIV
jgi:small ligand-binding sensory domain FIST